MNKNNGSNSRKGVYFSFDAIIASLIFILTLISVMSYWYGVREGIMHSDSILMDEAYRLSNLFLLPNSAGGVAIESHDKMLNSTRITNIANGVAGNILDIYSPYKYLIIVEMYSNHNNNNKILKLMNIYEIYSPGNSKNEIQNSKSVAKVVRIAPLNNGQIAVISFYTYEE